ncbi:type IX secretion system sortase PorU [Fulvivirgaceae bacterium BMA10]|uniref:Type IX secretion system sortase PorU n=1 Tax=Splendidivirga corallicola TaxID=3051826 RepID=A0ABT8KLD8_9BACT|nr:type IX secretion system sortase PorU [Fulvivirgaceae bacterium BMA10]
MKGLPCKVILIVLTICAFHHNRIRAQDWSIENHTIDWKTPESILNENGDYKLSLSFNGAVYHQGESIFPLKVIKLAGVKKETVEVMNKVYAPLTDLERLLVKEHISAEQSGTKKYELVQNKLPFTYIEIPPVIYDSTLDIPLKLVSFDIKYKKTGQPQERRETEQISSVLADGDWFKFGVTKDGVHKVDYATLNSTGISMATLDPRKIRIFGNGGAMLPQSNSVSRQEDLTENAIFVSGEDDGSFDQNDYILFYTKGPHQFKYNSDKDNFDYEHNIYSDTAYYFLNVGNENGLRIQNQENAGNNHPSISTYDFHIAHKNTLENKLRSGRVWYGERFKTADQSFDFAIPEMTGGANFKLEVSTMSYKSFDNNSSFNITLNSLTLGEQSFLAVASGQYSLKGRNQTDTFIANTNSIGDLNNAKVTLTFTPSTNSESLGYLNYLSINVKRNLKLYDNQTLFRSVESLGNAHSTFQISNVNVNTKIWDVTDPYEPKSQIFSIQANTATFGAETSSLKEFSVFNEDVSLADFFHKIDNQDLHGGGSANLIIIADNSLYSEAERLANFRSSNDGLTVKVVDIQKVYNEFSSGSQDISAIRDYMKYLYETGSGANELKYLLLFGDSSYDYKDVLEGNANKIPIYESRNSLHPTSTYSSDDYFGFLDDDEGEWTENPSENYLMDIGVGRLPVNNPEEARIVVNKLIHYGSSRSTLGSWRNEIYLSADDGDNNKHQQDAEKLAEIVESNYPQFNINKIYLDAFNQEKTPTGEISTGFEEAIDNAVNRGALIINYTGHGGEVQLAQEDVLNTATIKSWKNYDRLPVFVTATCEFGRHDDPLLRSGAEELLLNPNGGAIAMVTTSRPVFSGSNLLLNKAFYNAVFEQADGEYPRLGDVIMSTKNNSLDNNKNRNFSLLGDPSMQLNYPKRAARITEINGRPVGEADTLKALNKITLSGAVFDQGDSKITDYTGILYATVFDKKTTIETIGSDGPSMVYEERNNIIYRGRVSVANGDFSLEFIVPKNISYLIDSGKVSLYTENLENLIDGNGANIDLKIGGSSKIIGSDNNPPEIKLYMEDTLFVSGGSVSSNTLLLVNLRDESGINISSAGLGQDITATLDQKTTFILNEFYQTDLDSFQSGWIAFPINGLEKGEHSIKLKAWDTYNNSNEAEIRFVVSDENLIKLKEVSNYPNPLSTHTNFTIRHNRVGESLDITIEIFSIKGQLVTKIQRRIDNSNGSINTIEWDGRRDNGEKLGNGLYVYKVFVTSLLDGAKNQQFQKLVIIN